MSVDKGWEYVGSAARYTMVLSTMQKCDKLNCLSREGSHVRREWTDKHRVWCATLEWRAPLDSVWMDNLWCVGRVRVAVGPPLMRNSSTPTIVTVGWSFHVVEVSRERWLRWWKDWKEYMSHP